MKSRFAAISEQQSRDFSALSFKGLCTCVFLRKSHGAPCINAHVEIHTEEERVVLAFLLDMYTYVCPFIGARWLSLCEACLHGLVHSKACLLGVFEYEKLSTRKHRARTGQREMEPSSVRDVIWQLSPRLVFAARNIQDNLIFFSFFFLRPKNWMCTRNCA